MKLKKSIILKPFLLSLLASFLLTACNSGGAPSGNSTLKSEKPPSLQIVGGKSFDLLPKNTPIEQLSKATVGIKKFGIGFCTGVAITDNLLLTARHCVIEEGWKATIQKDKEMGLTLTTGSISPVVLDFKLGSKEAHTNEGDDLALIRFKTGTFEHFVGLDKMVSSQLFGKHVVVEALAGKLWNRNSKLYAFGWASKLPSRFQFLETSNADLGFPVGFKMGLQNAKGDVIDTYNFPGEDNRYNIWGFYREQMEMVHLSTNELAAASMTNSLEHKIPVEKGDSGGPIYSCGVDDQGCFLVAITSYGDSEKNPNGSETAMTLANPYFDAIFNEIVAAE